MASLINNPPLSGGGGFTLAVEIVSVFRAINMIAALRTNVFSIKLVWEYFYFLPTFRTLANKRIKISQLLKTGAMLRCRHGILLPRVRALLNETLPSKKKFQTNKHSYLEDLNSIKHAIAWVNYISLKFSALWGFSIEVNFALPINVEKFKRNFRKIAKPEDNSLSINL